MRITKIMTFASAIAYLASSGTAWAQAEVSGTDQVNAGFDDEILVTARRQSERLEKVPVSVTAISGDQLASQRILSEKDLQIATPGLYVREASSNNQLSFSLRGQSVDAFSFSSPAVLTYFNEFQVAGSTASSYFDLESIQVLQGPQGTLFGRNATGGAVLYQSVRPKDEFGGYFRGSIGNYSNRELEGAINVPLGSLGAFRLAGRLQDRKGYQRNLYYDPADRMNEVDNKIVRASLLLGEKDGFSTYTVGQFGAFDGKSAGLRTSSIYAVGQTNNGNVLNPTAAALYPSGVVLDNPRVAQLGFDGVLDYLAKLQANTGFYDVYNDAPGGHRARQYVVTNKTSYAFSDAFQINNIIGYNRVKSRDQTDVDTTPFQILTIGAAGGPDVEGYTYTTKQFSNELNVTGEILDGKLNYIAGLYYSRQTDEQNNPLNVGADYPGGSALPTGNYRYHFRVKDISKAIFAQLTYALTDRLSLTAGGRMTWEKIGLNHLTTSSPPDAFALAGVPNAQSKVSKPSWTVSLGYEVTNNLNLYASHRGSFRTGGFNGTSATVDPVTGATVTNAFGPETTYDFEIGAKFSGRVAGLPARLNIALYDQYIDDVQRAVYFGVAALSGNVEAARVYGVQVDGTVRPAAWLELGGNLAYTKPKYTKPDAVVGGQTLTFGPYGDTPKFTGAAFFRATHDLSNDTGEIALRGDVYHQSSTYFSNLDASIVPGTRLNGYTIVNGRLEINEIGGSPFSAALWAKNLFDKKYYSGGLGFGAVIGVNGVIPAAPRMWGLELSAEF